MFECCDRSVSDPGIEFEWRGLTILQYIILAPYLYLQRLYPYFILDIVKLLVLMNCYKCYKKLLFPKY